MDNIVSLISGLSFGAILIKTLEWGLAYMLRHLCRSFTPELIRIRAWSWLLSWGGSHTLRGKCRLSWFTDSVAFEAKNETAAEIWNSGDSIAIVVSGYKNGAAISNYVFIGKIQDKMITGSWHDRDDRTSGYHGAFQLILHPTKTVCRGRWIGYSTTKNDVDVGRLTLSMI